MFNSQLKIKFGGTGRKELNDNHVLLGQGSNPIDDTKEAPLGKFVGTLDTQILTNKTLTSQTNNITASSLFSNDGKNRINIRDSEDPLSRQVLMAVDATNVKWKYVSDGMSSGNGIDRERLKEDQIIEIICSSQFNFDDQGLLNLSKVSVKDGGTGLSSFPEDNVLIGNGTASLNVSKKAPEGDFVGTTDNQSLTFKTLSDISNNITANSLFISNTRRRNAFEVKLESESVEKGQVLMISKENPNIASWKYISETFKAGRGINALELLDHHSIHLNTSSQFCFDERDCLNLKTVSVHDGGTGCSSFPPNSVLIGNGNSLDISKKAPEGNFVGTLDTQTLTNKILTDASNHVTSNSLFTNNGLNSISVSTGSIPNPGDVLCVIEDDRAEWRSVKYQSGKGIDSQKIDENIIEIDHTSNFTIVDDSKLELSTVPVSFGGTGLTEIPSNSVLIGNGISLDISKQAPQGNFVGTTDEQILTNKISTDSTNITTASLLFSNFGSNTINIRSADNPRSGQVLTAVDSTNAFWADIRSPLKAGNGIFFDDSLNIHVNTSNQFQINHLNQLELSTVTVKSGGTGCTEIPKGKVLVGQNQQHLDISKNAPQGNFVGTFDTQEITNKTLTDNSNSVAASFLFSNQKNNLISLETCRNPVKNQVLTAIDRNSAEWRDLPDFNYQNTIIVSKNANNTYQNYSSLSKALASIVNIRNESIIIMIHPGKYSEVKSLIIPENVHIVGIQKQCVEIVYENNTQEDCLFLLSDNCSLSNLVLENISINNQIGVKTINSTKINLSNIVCKNFNVCFKISGINSIVYANNCTCISSDEFEIAKGFECTEKSVLYLNHLQIEITNSSKIERIVYSHNSNIYVNGLQINSNGSINELFYTDKESFLSLSLMILNKYFNVSLYLLQQDNSICYLNNIFFDSSLQNNKTLISTRDSKLYLNNVSISKNSIINFENSTEIFGNFSNDHQNLLTIPNNLEVLGDIKITNHVISPDSIILIQQEIINNVDQRTIPKIDLSSTALKTYSYFCDFATTKNIDIQNAPSEIDSETPQEEISKILVVANDNVSENGLYIWNGEQQAMSRISLTEEFIDRNNIYVLNGQKYSKSHWSIDDNNNIRNHSLKPFSKTNPEESIFYIGHPFQKFLGISLAILAEIQLNDGDNLKNVLIWEFWNGGEWENMNDRIMVVDNDWNSFGNHTFSFDHEIPLGESINYTYRINLNDSWFPTSIEIDQNTVQKGYFIRARLFDPSKIKQFPVIHKNIKLHFDQIVFSARQGKLEYFGYNKIQKECIHQSSTIPKICSFRVPENIDTSHPIFLNVYIFHRIQDYHRPITLKHSEKEIHIKNLEILEGKHSKFIFQVNVSQVIPNKSIPLLFELDRFEDMIEYSNHVNIEIEYNIWHQL